MYNAEVGRTSHGRSKHQKQNPLQLLLSIFEKTAPATGELVSTRQQPTDSTVASLVKPPTVTPLPDGLRNGVLSRFEVVEGKIADSNEAHKPPEKNNDEDIPF